MSVAVAVFLVVAAATAIAYPLLIAPSGRTRVDHLEEPERLEREKKIALIAIREAETDYAMGKLSEHDYHALRAQYEQRAAAAMAALDRVQATARATRKSAGGTGADPVPARFCSSCGRRYDRGERYCPMCGTPRAITA